MIPVIDVTSLIIYNFDSFTTIDIIVVKFLP